MLSMQAIMMPTTIQNPPGVLVNGKSLKFMPKIVAKSTKGKVRNESEVNVFMTPLIFMFMSWLFVLSKSETVSR